MTQRTAADNPFAPLEVGDQVTALIVLTSAQVTLTRTNDASWRVSALDCYARPIYPATSFAVEQAARIYARHLTGELRQVACRRSPLQTLIRRAA